MDEQATVNALRQQLAASRQMLLETQERARQAEQRLAEADATVMTERFSMALASGPIIVFSQDTSLRHTWIHNPVPGFSPEVIIGKTDLDLHSPEDGQMLTELKQRVLDSGRGFHGEVWTTNLDVAYCHDLRVEPLRDAAGGIVGVIGTAVDITQHKQMEQELVRARGELELRVQERTNELAQAKDQLQGLARELVTTLENERSVIARELHDEAGQVLTSLKIALGMLQQDSACPPPMANRLEELRQIVDQLMDELRRLAMTLRPGTLDRVGLMPAIQQYAQAFAEKTGLAVQLECSDLAGNRFAAEIETALYRIMQEALTNIARHAAATRAGIVVRLRGDRIVLIVEDDGKGFEIGEALLKGHLGLAGMRERAEMLGGRLTIETGACEGTTIFVEIPASR